MASHERLGTQSSIAPHKLTDRLAKVLTKDAVFKLYHVSTPPTRTPAIFSAPPGEHPDRTYRESHFLAVSINTDSNTAQVGRDGAGEVLVYAIEVLIYSTAYSTTFFVSKADSTGYLCHLSLPKGSPSPLKDISAVFLSYLVDLRTRLGVRSIVSLFARAQGQYLFPGSSDNSLKHVLDDRGLIRWWCRVLNPLVEGGGDAWTAGTGDGKSWESIRGFLKVPGLDDHDAKSYLPKGLNASATIPWTIGHPLHNLSHFQGAIPPRCLIPRFPDDPKSRFLDELDDELPTSGGKVISAEWRSVRTLDQFWEMMAFRQECSAGRLVGFIWIVFEPASRLRAGNPAPAASQNPAGIADNILEDDEALPDLPDFSLTSPNSSLAASSQEKSTSSLSNTNEADASHPKLGNKHTGSSLSKKRRLHGPVIPRQPRIKTHNRTRSLERPEETQYYSWPRDGRGQMLLEEKDYSRVTELLLHLDFTDLGLALGSTDRWVSEARSGHPSRATYPWGSSVTGTKAFEVKREDGKLGVRTLNVGLVRKKRKAPVEEGDTT